jgi:hypothetical protein
MFRLDGPLQEGKIIMNFHSFFNLHQLRIHNFEKLLFLYSDAADFNDRADWLDILYLYMVLVSVIHKNVMFLDEVFDFKDLADVFSKGNNCSG